MINPSEKRTVTVEDLIRLKRAERPSAEFWTKFEAELRARQLAAIVGKRPWWARISVARLLRHPISIGATALVAITALSVRTYQSASLAAPEPLDETATITASAGEVVVPTVSSVAPALEVTPQSDGAAVAALPQAETANTSGSYSQIISPGLVSFSSESSRASEDGRLAAFVQLGRSDLSPAERSIVDNLAAAKETHPELSERFFGAAGFEKRASGAHLVVDPLSRMRNPSELHRERLLASAVAAAPTVSARTPKRNLPRISDERLTEEVGSRFGARGDSLSVKF